MGGGDINYPAQPSYGEGLADAMRAQASMATGAVIGEETAGADLLAALQESGLIQEGQLLGEAIADIDKRIRSKYGQSEVDLIGQRLLGDIERFDEKGEIRETVYDPYDDAELGGYYYAKGEDVGTFGGKQYENYLMKDGKIVAGSDQDTSTGSLLQYIDEGDDPEAIKAAFQKRIDEPRGVAREEVRTGEAGTIASRSGGLLDLYGGNTKVRQVDPETGEVTYGTAGFDPESGEFQGLIPMQQQAQAYLASQQRESDIADVEKFGTRATEAIREQGDIRGALSDLSTYQNRNLAQTGTARQMLMGEAIRNIGQGLSAREQRDIEQASRQAGAATGRMRDLKRLYEETEAIVEGNRLRRQQNLAQAQSILGSEMGMKGQEMAMGLQRLGAEQLTAADPMMAILGRPSSNAPAAGGLAQMGMQTQQQSGPQFFNPEAGLGYIQNAATNQANIAAAQAGAQGSAMSGLFQGLGTVGGAALMCWVAREVYGSDNPRWLQFRAWMLTDSPKWLLNLYIKYGERFANWISNKPTIKSMIRYWMDTRIA